MKKLVVLLFCTVSSLQFVENHEEYNLTKNVRMKRQEDRWSWGFVVVPDTTTVATDMDTATVATDTATNTDTDTVTNTDTRTSDNENPCLNNTYSPKPDFSVLGKRISETKCYEYIWDVKHRDEVDQRSADCIAYKIKNRGPLDPYFAIGGRDTAPGEFPHMGAVGWKSAIGTWVFKCGSSLISPKFVLTAAHCSSVSTRDTSVADPVPQIVRLGDKNILDTFYNGVLPRDEKIINIIVHPNYSSPKKYFDIALMELENEVQFDRLIQPACLWSDDDVSKLGTVATLTGWGVLEAGSLTISPELQAATVDLVEEQLCDSLLRPSCNRHWCGLQPHQFCAGKLAGGVDACKGDSGGPLQVQIPLPTTTQGSMHYVIGVTSFGISCARPNLPGVYTRVSSFVDWVEENVWKK